jgi:hypothetical protein
LDSNTIEQITQQIPNIITKFDNEQLMKIPTEEEIWVVVKDLPKNSAPSPNNFNSFFYQYYFSTIKEDLIPTIQCIFRSRAILRSWKSTFLALIPKNNNP